MNLRELADRIHHQLGGISRDEVYQVLRLLIENTVETLGNGEEVRYGRLCSFQPHLRRRGRVKTGFGVFDKPNRYQVRAKIHASVQDRVNQIAAEELSQI